MSIGVFITVKLTKFHFGEGIDLGGLLSEGTVEGASIRCPWHGSRFALEDDRVLDSPATFPQPCLEARVRDGQIEVRIHQSAGTGKSAAIKG